MTESTPTHPDLAQQIAVALERAGLGAFAVESAAPLGCWLDHNRFGAMALFVTPTVFQLGSNVDVPVGIEWNSAIAIVRAVLAGNTPARLAVEAGVGWDLGAMFRWCIGRGWVPHVHGPDDEINPGVCRASIWDSGRPAPTKRGPTPEDALAEAILFALAAQPDPRGEE